MRMKLLTVALAAAFIYAPAQANAGTIVVEPTDDLESAVENAGFGDVVELKQGTHLVTCLPEDSPCITIPSGVTIMADPGAPPRSVVVEGGDNTNRIIPFGSTGTDIEISGIKFEPDSMAPNGGRAVWLALGGGDLLFNDNVVHQFTDAVFARGQTTGEIKFINNVVELVDRDPDSNNGFLGGNAAFTALFVNLTNFEAAGNVVHGPGRNVDRFIAVTGVIVFNFDTQTIDDIDIWNNAISNVDIAIFSSGGVTNTSVIAENRLHSNGAGVVVGQVPPPDITDPTPAVNTNVLQNRISGNNFGLFIASNATDTFIERNQIAGNSDAAFIDDGTNTVFGENLIRGKDTGTPDTPPGLAFDPVTGSVN